MHLSLQFLDNCKKLKSVERLPLSLQFLDAQGCDNLEADSVETFKDRPKKEPRNACFQETEMASYVLNHQATRSRQTISLPKITPATIVFLGIPICIMLVAILVNLHVQLTKT